jgi:hypothetical protein
MINIVGKTSLGSLVDFFCKKKFPPEIDDFLLWGSLFFDIFDKKLDTICDLKQLI